MAYAVSEMIYAGILRSPMGKNLHKCLVKTYSRYYYIRHRRYDDYRPQANYCTFVEEQILADTFGNIGFSSLGDDIKNIGIVLPKLTAINPHCGKCEIDGEAAFKIVASIDETRLLHLLFCELTAPLPSYQKISIEFDELFKSLNILKNPPIMKN